MKNSFTVALATVASMLVAATGFASQTNSVVDVERRVEVILKQMTLEEKIDLLGGVNGVDVRGVPRLGVPVLATADGPFGVRRLTRSNAMAGGIALAATWNPELARKLGNEVGRDARARGVHFYLAPGVRRWRRDSRAISGARQSWL
jgi:beta-glucosidase